MKNHLIKSLTTIKILVISGLVILLASCSNEPEIEITLGEPIELTASHNQVILLQAEATEKVLELTWTTGSNMGTGASIEYTIEMDLAGNNFAFPLQFSMGKRIYTRSFTHAELNGFLIDFFEMEPNTTGQIETRVIAKIASDNVQDDISDIIGISVATYSPVSSTLYMIGTATPNGWSADEPLPMESASGSPGTFRYRGELAAGELKFITTLGAFIPSYNRGDDDNSLFYRTSLDQPDDKFIMPLDGNYEIELNIIDLTISIVQYDVLSFENIYLVGDASPSGWNIGSPLAFTQDTENQFIFTWEGNLNAGEIKFSTFTGEWCDGQWINPPVADMPISNNSFIVTNGCEGPDNKWRLLAADAGSYLITIDLENETINFAKQ